MSYQVKDAARYARAQWLEKFEVALLRLRPNLRGRVNWGNAHWYYCQGLTPQKAAEKEVA